MATEHGLNETIQGRTVADKRGAKFQAFPLREDGHPVIPHASGDKDPVPRPDASRGKIDSFSGIQPIPAVLMKILSALPRSTTLVSPATILTPALLCCFSHRGDDSLKIRIREPFFENISRQSGRGVGTDHGEIIHCPAYSQLPDVSTRKKDGRIT